MAAYVTIRQALDNEALTGTAVSVAGWVRTFRNDRFIVLNDGSTIRNLQCVIDQAQVDDATRARFTVSASLRCRGELVPSLGSGQRVELKVTGVEVLGDSDAATYPIQPKKHSLEFLREQAHLRFRTSIFSAVFRIRHEVSFGIHEYFAQNGFNSFHAPIITASDAEGAGELFRVSVLDAKKPPLTPEGEVDFAQDFFGQESRLTVSGQLQAELAALALGKVYTFGPTFRAENSNTTRHLAEFWMIEPEVAFNDLTANMDLAEGLCKHLIARVLMNSVDDLQFLDARLKEEEGQKPLAQRSEMGLIERLRFVLDNAFERITYDNAVDILLQSKPSQKKQFQFPVKWGMDLQSEHERYLVEKHFKKPVIVTGYPAAIKAFYMRMNSPGDFGYSDKGPTVAAMDVLFPGIGEIIGGSQREERYDQLVERMRAMNVPEKELWWYLDTRKFGTVPHAGFGLGLERFVQFVTGMGNIRDVIPFPQNAGERGVLIALSNSITFTPRSLSHRPYRYFCPYMLKQYLSQRLQQKLSPQQIQLMKLLQVPTAELEQRIKSEIEENPALEEGEDTGEEEEPSEEQAIAESQEENEQTKDEDFDLSDYYDDETPDYKLSVRNTGPDEEDRESPLAGGTTFQEVLMDQFSLREVDERAEQLGQHLIGNLDEDGYLRRDLGSIVNDLAFTMNIMTEEAELEKVLKQVQALDPPGVGARDLRECLLLQLHRMPHDVASRTAQEIVDKHFEAFSKKHYEKILERLEIDEEALKGAMEVIQRLNPRPGNTTRETDKPVQEIVPDFIINTVDGQLELQLNSRNAPELRVSRKYREMIDEYKRSKKEPGGANKEQKEALMFIKQKLDGAKWFIDAIKQRQHTLLTTMEAIMEHQRQFFLTGDETKLKPMILKDIAEKVRMDISTVSRVANSKYVQSPYGTFLLKFFFSESLTNDQGEEVSTREVKKILKDAIEAEIKQKPLTDDELTALLKQKGYNIARRTVAKYREQLDIPVARLRKQL